MALSPFFTVDRQNGKSMWGSNLGKVAEPVKVETFDEPQSASAKGNALCEFW